ncbi:MAG: glycosyltransferase, partial [Eubacteriales bacterium]|nr:glycosyltransferase [Eubacteriales bacterium]
TRMATPKVSVIIPVYNAEQYLSECLNSLINQTLKDLEIICVDDGSTDHSLSILNQYAQKDKRITVIQQKNLYAGVARNNGLQAAKGEYVIFLDSDDFFDIQLLEKTYVKGCETNADIILFGGEKYNTQTSEYTEAPYFLRKEFLPENPVFSRNDIPDQIMTVTTPAPWTKLYRRQFILEENLKFQPFPNSNDAYFVLVSLCLAKKITYVDESLVYYRIGSTENIQSNKWKNPLCFLKAYEAVYEELVRRNIFEEVEKSYVDVTISGCKFNLDTITDDEARLTIYHEIMSADFQKTGVLDHPIEYYSNWRNCMQVRGVKYALLWYEKMRKKADNSGFQILKQNSLHSTPLVSVIVPVYNVEPYLKECLESIRQQTLSSIEIICINDGSADLSLNILLECAEHDNRISVFSQQNSGQSAARNAGVRQASGEYIYFMDSDDILDIHALSVMYEQAKEDDLDVVYCDGSSFSDSEHCEESVEIYKEYYVRKHPYPGLYPGAALMRDMLSHEEYRVSPCLQLIKRSHFLKHDLWFCEGIIHEDNIFNYCCMLSADKTGYIGRSLFNRRIRPDSVMTSQTSFHHVYGYFYSYIKMNDFIQNTVLESDNAKAALEILSRVLKNARTAYSKLPEDEKYSALGLPHYQQTLFKLYVSDVEQAKKDLYIVRTRLQQT